MVRGQSRHRHSNASGGRNTTKPPLTHCKYRLSLLFPLADFFESPITPHCKFRVLAALIVSAAAADLLQGHHESLQKSVSAFTSGLLETTPMLPGLDRTIVIPSRRLHLTLGVMSLDDSEPSDSRAINSRKTLSEALSLLSSLRPQISELLCGTRLKVPLQMMNIMPPDGRDPDRAHVLWLGPSLENEDAQRLLQVGGECQCCGNFICFADDLLELVNKTFAEAGFISDRRPLKVCLVFLFFSCHDKNAFHQLHCTVLNTTHRRPRTRGRQPFSYRSLLGSPAAQAFLLQSGSEPDWRQPVKVDFGTWHVDEIQICKMGSYGREGEYESCGGLLLSLPPP